MHMTKIVFFHSEGHFYGFEEQGHTGFGGSGEDILCSAISAMTMLIINTVLVSYATDLDYKIDEETTNISVRCAAALPDYEEDERKSYAISGLFHGYYQQIKDLTEEYYQYLEVELVEKPFEE